MPFIDSTKLDFISVLIIDTTPDILVISETWLSSKTPDSDVTLPGFNLHRIDRKAKGGGVIIYTREHLVTRVISASSVPKSFECIALDVCIGGNAHITVVGAYRPPSAPTSALNDLGVILSNLTSSELVVLGDLNQDWLSETSASLKQLLALRDLC